MGRKHSGTKDLTDAQAMAVRKRLKTWIDRNRYSLNVAETKLDVKAETLSRVLRGIPCRETTLSSVAKGIGITLSELLSPYPDDDCNLTRYKPTSKDRKSIPAIFFPEDLLKISEIFSLVLKHHKDAYSPENLRSVGKIVLDRLKESGFRSELDILPSDMHISTNKS